MGSPIAGYGGALVITSAPSVDMTGANATSNPSGDNQTFVISNAGHRYWDPSQPVTVQAAWDEVQQVAITGSPTGGSFTLTWNGDTTAAIAYNATAAQVQSALAALVNIGNGNVACTGGPLPSSPISVEWLGTLADANQPAMTFTNSLTGGAAPTPVITTLQQGQTLTTITTGFAVRYVGGYIIFTTPLLGTASNMQVKVTTYYFPWATIANMTQWSFDGQMNFQDITSCLGDGQGGLLAGAGWKMFQPLLVEGTFTATQFWVPESQYGFWGDISARTQFILSGVAMTGNRYEGYAYLKKDSIKDDVAKLAESSLDFQVNGQFYIV